MKTGRITRKINLLLSLGLGLGFTTVYFAFTQNLSLIRSTQENLEQQSDILYQSIKNAMLPGQAPIAVSLFADIREINPAYDIGLYRTNGIEAFSDNGTIAFVNGVLGRTAFEPKDAVGARRPALDSDEIFMQSVATRKGAMIQESIADMTFMSLYKPLLNLPKCTACHGSGHTVRGVIKIAHTMASFFLIRFLPLPFYSFSEKSSVGSIRLFTKTSIISNIHLQIPSC